jgi:hypothetical protein
MDTNHILCETVRQQNKELLLRLCVRFNKDPHRILRAYNTKEYYMPILYQTVPKTHAQVASQKKN